MTFKIIFKIDNIASTFLSFFNILVFPLKTKNLFIPQYGKNFQQEKPLHTNSKLNRTLKITSANTTVHTPIVMNTIYKVFSINFSKRIAPERLWC